MKKLMMLAAMLAMALVAAAPALAQDAVIEGDDESSTDETSVEAGQYSQVAVNDCEQVLDQVAYQYNAPVADVSGDENEVAQGGNGVDAEQVQYCVNLLQGGFNEADVDEDDDGVVEEGEGAAAAAAAAASASSGEESSGEESSSEESSSSEEESSSESSEEESSGEEEESSEELPETGGFGLLTLGAGALLVAGGVVARRIVR
ncbi:hypothetical protein GBA65_12750 [Rubrobacter marinus]|uniref:Gram-positive cocci surface proteins LPxTG domain-containing protein n=1 Tax=Rubrobacter marinus TaxID=2653852 RepID=A0A6G8PYF6_9ACTN|nr:hypothetical protein [Rubrobacter marinus]QIN79241.1 hypothetical protein GBA65_12750 [Rubrobacter marinus]